jgi:hypothetical protein
LAVVGTPAAVGAVGAAAVAATLALVGEVLGALGAAGDGGHAPLLGDPALAVERDDRGVAEGVDLLVAAQPCGLVGLGAAVGGELVVVEGDE